VLEHFVDVDEGVAVVEGFLLLVHDVLLELSVGTESRLMGASAVTVTIVAVAGHSCTSVVLEMLECVKCGIRAK